MRPKTKWLHFSNPNITAAASPSIGAYRLSAAVVNLEPQKTVCHPVLQHPNVGVPGHLQCFWTSHHPMQNLLQSVANPVGAFMLNSLTPFSHCRTISSLEAKNALSKSSFHMNGICGRNNCRKGSITSETAKVYEICCTQPNQLRTSVMDFGTGNDEIFLTKSAVGLRP